MCRVCRDSRDPSFFPSRPYLCRHTTFHRDGPVRDRLQPRIRAHAEARTRAVAPNSTPRQGLLNSRLSGA
jgi:hypothetical protein